MITQLTQSLALVLIDERLRTAQEHRSHRARTYSLPVVREIPRRIELDPLAGPTAIVAGNGRIVAR